MAKELLRKSRTTVVGILGITVILAGCAGLKSDRTIASERAEAYLSTHPKLGAKTAGAIRTNAIRVGMTMEQVIAAWGRPAEIQKFRDGKVQHWFFGCDWPHVCDSQSDRSRLRPGGIFEDPNQRYLSQALFENGVVVKFWS